MRCRSARAPSGFFGAPGATKVTDFPPLATTLLFDPEHAALKRAEVILPTSIQPSLPGAQRACSREAATAESCPESSRVGTATIDSPLQPAPVKGPVYIAFNTPAPLPGLLVTLPPPVGVRLDGAVDSGPFGTRNVFASNPDLPGEELHARSSRAGARMPCSRWCATSARRTPTGR